MRVATLDSIVLHNCLPHVFAERGAGISQVWETDLVLRRGTSVLIEAESGAGKSSLCSYIYGHRGDYTGEIALDGRNIRQLSANDWSAIRTHSLAILWQDLRLFADLTALENIRLKNSLTDFHSESEIRQMLIQLEIDDKIHTPVGCMSIGQQQRLAIVRLLCQPMHFIIMDEPISHLDDVRSASVAQLVTDKAERQGAGIIVTSVGKHLPLNYDHTYKL